MSAIVGHQIPLSLLDRSVAESRVGHAYVLHGPTHVGKSTVARWFAKRLNCTGDAPPCGQCRACRLIDQAKYVDVREVRSEIDSDPPMGVKIEPAKGSGRSTERAIGIDKIEALQRDASLAPYEGRWKVYVISGAERMTLEASNCLLKTLEEPTEHVVFILTTSDAGDLLPTVTSRCLRIRLPLVPVEQITAGLMASRGLDRKSANKLARLSGGRPGWAFSAADDPSVEQESREVLALLGQFLSPHLRDRFAAAERLSGMMSKSPQRVYGTLETWRLWLWDALLYTYEDAPTWITNVDDADRLRETGHRLGAERIRALIEGMARTMDYLRQNVNPRLALEALAFELERP